MKTLSFSANYNNKLDNNYFTTIRKFDLGKFKVGDIVAIFLNGHLYGYCQVLFIFPFSNFSITDEVAYLDAGMSSNELRNLLANIYKQDPLDDYFLSKLLLKRIYPSYEQVKSWHENNNTF